MPPGADEGEAAEKFAADLMDKWGVGDASCNDGVLLLLTLQPRQVCLLEMSPDWHTVGLVVLRVVYCHTLTSLSVTASTRPLDSLHVVLCKSLGQLVQP